MAAALVVRAFGTFPRCERNGGSALALTDMNA